MKSWEILKQAVEGVGVKAVAARLKVSTALVYKWCQESAADDPLASGARNPLDRVQTLVGLTGDTHLVNWLCNSAGGFFVANPRPDASLREEQLLGVTQRVVEDFGQLLTNISRSIENDGAITADEADTIRQSWEELKTQAEGFVVACERGQFSRKLR